MFKNSTFQPEVGRSFSTVACILESTNRWEILSGVPAALLHGEDFMNTYKEEL